MADLTLKVVTPWQRSNDAFVARVRALPSLSRFRRFRSAQTLVTALGFVGIALGIAGLVPTLAYSVGFIGLGWTVISYLFLERRELEAIKSSRRIAKEAKIEVARLRNEIEILRNLREDTRRAKSLWQPWIEESLLKLRDSSSVPSADVEADTERIYALLNRA